MINVLIGLLNFLKQCLLFCFRGRMVVSIGDCIRMTGGRAVMAEIYKYGKESFYWLVYSDASSRQYTFFIWHHRQVQHVVCYYKRYV